MNLRPYQQRAVDLAMDQLRGGAKSTLLVLPTGAGKTVVFAHIAMEFAKTGRVLIIAHREELIRQAAKKIAAVTNEVPEIEMADEWANHDADHPWASKYIVASIQSLISGKKSDDKKRLHRFPADQFSLVIIDECVTGDTLISLADGRRVRIDGFAGGEVLALSLEGRIVSRKAVLRSMGVRRIIRISLADDATIRCTPEHLVFTQRGFVAAADLTRSDYVLKCTNDGQSKTTIGIRELAGGRACSSIGSVSQSSIHGQAFSESVGVSTGEIRDIEGLDADATERTSERRMGRSAALLQHSEPRRACGSEGDLLSRQAKNCDLGMVVAIGCDRPRMVVHGRRLATEGRHSDFNGGIQQEGAYASEAVAPKPMGNFGDSWPIKEESSSSSLQSRSSKEVLPHYRATHNSRNEIQAFHPAHGLLPRVRRRFSSIRQSIAILFSAVVQAIGFLWVREASIFQTSRPDPQEECRAKRRKPRKENLRSLRRVVPSGPANSVNMRTERMPDDSTDAKLARMVFEKLPKGNRAFKVASIEDAGEEEEVFDLTVEDCHNYFANGVLVHNCHHATARSYRDVMAHFKDAPLLGVTATGDRGDGEGLGSVFESIAFTYELPDAINDGWLVPVHQRSVVVEDLDFSKCKTTGGDLNQGDLADIMEFEKTMYPVAHATLELAAGLEIGTLTPLKDDEERHQKLAAMISGRPLLKTLVFTVSVRQAERLAEIFNRWLKDCAQFVCGTTPPEERAKLFANYKAGRFSILVNVGITTEGWDEPGVEVVVLARPTKSRALHAQMCGRGTRPIESIAGELGKLESADDRKMMIEANEKKFVTILDFVGNTGKHKLITVADILSGDFVSDGVIARANELAQEQSIDVSEALRLAQEEEEEANQLRAEAQAARDQDEEDHLAEVERRARLVGTAQYQIQTSDPFDKFSRGAPRVQASGPRGGSTDAQIEFLVSLGCERKTAMGYTKGQAGAVITSMKDKHHTVKQGRYLAFLGYSQGDIDAMNFDAASAAIGAAKARQEAQR